MKYVNLTRPSGRTIYVNPNWVSVIEHDDKRELTKIEIGSILYYWVTEDMNDVAARCEANMDNRSV